MSIDALKAALSGKKKAKKSDKVFLSTGCTLLNLACADRYSGGLMAGGYYLIWGDSSAGKSVLISTILAEAAINPAFDDYELIFDNVENGAMFFEKFFGPKIAARIKAPRYDKSGNPIYSKKVEDFYANVYEHTHKKKCVYILDSEPALSSDQEQEKQAEVRDAIRKGKETTGIMTDGKAAVHSRNLRDAAANVRDSGSILCIVSQSRDRLGFGAQFDPRTRPGGKALKFYAQLEIFLNVYEKIKRTVKGKKRSIGVRSQMTAKKNRFTGKDRQIVVPIFYSVGFDDIGGNIDYLVEEKHWKESSGVLSAPEFDFKGDREKLIAKIEEAGEEKKLAKLVSQVWHEIEAACAVNRKNKYMRQ